jgi:enamine deaminase RidA (YjgF/YER057c/UK114 family)
MEETMHQMLLTNLGGREHLVVNVTGAGGGSIADEARRAMDSAFALIEQSGFPTSSIVRSRIFARDANARRIASDLRVEMLKGALRAASSSYIDPARLPEAANVAVDLIAARTPAGVQKVTREYEPPIAPPMFVALGDMVYVSGCTDTSDGFDAQIANVRCYIARNLDAAGAKWTDVTGVSAHVSRKIDLADAWRKLNGLFPHLAGTMSLSPVDGYSAPEKLIEIEATARLG